MGKKCRLIWDDCTPARERRPITLEDVFDDIHIKEFNSEEKLLDHLLELAGYDEDDYSFSNEESTIEKIELVLTSFNDPGDGSPNILYASIDGKELEGSLPYDCLDVLDLETCKVKDVIQVIAKDLEVAREFYIDINTMIDTK